MNDQKDKLWPMLQKLGVRMKSDEKKLMGKPLMKRAMQTWLPASTALLEMMIFHLPSPHTAQRNRVENLYEGPLDDQYATAIRNCDPNGPLMLYVSKMIPASFPETNDWYHQQSITYASSKCPSGSRVNRATTGRPLENVSSQAREFMKLNLVLYSCDTLQSLQFSIQNHR